MKLLRGYADGFVFLNPHISRVVSGVVFTIDVCGIIMSWSNKPYKTLRKTFVNSYESSKRFKMISK